MGEIDFKQLLEERIEELQAIIRDGRCRDVRFVEGTLRYNIFLLEKLFLLFLNSFISSFLKIIY